MLYCWLKGKKYGKKSNVGKTKNGRIILLSKCVVCDSAKSRFTKEQEGSKLFSSLVCVCVCVCFCVSVYTLPPVGFFRLHEVFDIREKFRSMIFRFDYQLTALCQVPSSPYLKMPYFTSKDENSSRSITGEKTI